jgi:hypothetical protein
MALSPSQGMFWPRLREQKHLRRYRQQLLERNLLTRSTPLLAHLERLPLTVQPARQEPPGARLPLAQALAQAPRIRIVSQVRAERSLIVRQLCLHWAQEQGPLAQLVPLLINLAPGGGTN